MLWGSYHHKVFGNFFHAIYNTAYFLLKILENFLKGKFGLTKICITLKIFICCYMKGHEEDC